MLLHIGLSIIVLQGVIHKRFYYVGVAIIIHGFVDAIVGILPLFLPQNNALVVVETSLAIIAIVVFGYSLYMKKRG